MNRQDTSPENSYGRFRPSLRITKIVAAVGAIAGAGLYVYESKDFSNFHSVIRQIEATTLSAGLGAVYALIALALPAATHELAVRLKPSSGDQSGESSTPTQ